MSIKLSFNKQKKIKQKKMFEALFNKKKASSFYCHPFKVNYILKEELPQTKFGLSVPKRNFKLAVDRNLVKRKIKEAYRINQYSLKPKTTGKFILFFIYTPKKLLPYAAIEKGVKKTLKLLNSKANELDQTNN